MVSQQDYYQSRQPQPPRPPAPYSSSSNSSSPYPTIRPLPSPNAPPRAPPQQSYPSYQSPTIGGPSGYSYARPSTSSRGGGVDYIEGRSGQNDARRISASLMSPQSQHDLQQRQGGYRREASSGFSVRFFSLVENDITSPSSPALQQPRAPSPLPPLPPRTTFSPGPSAPSHHSQSPTRSSHSPTNRSFSPQSHHQPSHPSSALPAGTICTATADLESLAVVPLGSLSSIDAVKDVIMSRLHIADEDMPRHAFYLTNIGRGEGRPVSDGELWETLARSGSGEGPQITVFVKEVVASNQAGVTGADFAGGMSAEKMRQVQHAREREREREQRERDKARGKEREASGGSGRSPTNDGQRRPRGASISSGSASQRGGGSGNGAARPVSLVEVDEFGTPLSLRSDRPAWASQGVGAQSWSHQPRRVSASEGGTPSAVPHPRTVSGGQLSPPPERGPSSGFRAQVASPEDYFQSSPPLSGSAVVQSPPTGAPSSHSSYHPHLPTSPPQIVMGPSGPTRFLPPHPQQNDHHDPRQRHQTAPAIQVSTPAWSHSTAAPHHQNTHPPSASVYRPTQSQFSPPIARPLPPTDPRLALPQYSSQPYKNLPLPSGSSPYHNLSLQGQYASVVQVPQPPSSMRPGTLLPQGQDSARLLSKSADNLRGHFSSTPPQPPPHPQGYRSPSNPTMGGSSNTSGSRTPQASSPPTSVQSSSFVTYPSPSPTPASAFYSAPVQAQHQAASRAGPSSTSGSGGGSAYSHSQSQSYVPHPPPRRPTLEQSSYSQPTPLASSTGSSGGGGNGGNMRNSTMQGLTSGELELRPGETVRQGKMRRASETVAGNEEEEGKSAMMAAARRRASNGSGGGSELQRSTPASLTAGGGKSPSSSPSSQRISPPLARDSPALPSTFVSPAPSAPPFQDDDGAYDGIPDAARRPLRSSNNSHGTSSGTSEPSSSARNSTSSPITPADSFHPAAPAPPPLLDEFGDPIDEETSTWFPVPGQQLPQLVSPKATTQQLDEFGDPLDEETSTWFNVPGQQPVLVAPTLAVLKEQKLDEFGDPVDEETSTWFPGGGAPLPPPPAPPVKPAPLPLQPPSSVTEVRTTAVPSPALYGTSSPMRRTHSGPNSNPGSALPSTPGSSSASHGQGDSVPTAQDWTQTILSRFGASAVDGGEDGTLLPGGPASGTLRPIPPPIEVPKPKRVDEFGDDLDEEEGATFFPLSMAPTPSASTPHSPGFDRHKRPNLRLTIDAPTPPPSTPNKPDSGGSSGEQAELPPLPNIASRRSANPGSDSTFRRGGFAGPRSGPIDDLVRLAHSPLPNIGSPSPFARRNSFAARAQDDKDWAFRPPIETVLEHLDVFFPEHDLDKPVFDLPTPGASTPSTTSSTSPIRDVAAVTPSALSMRRVGGGMSITSSSAGGGTSSGSSGGSGATGLGYKKSIRVVALDRKRQLQKAGRNVASAASGLASNLLRRRSTKLFGARIEEVTSAQMKQINMIKETSAEDPENCAFPFLPFSFLSFLETDSTSPS